MPVTHGELIRELASLRKGLGIETPFKGVRNRDSLLAIAGVDHDAAPDTFRKTLTEKLSALTNELIPDLQLVARVALNLAPGETRSMQLERRIDWLAEQLERNPRTIRRKLDEAMNTLAEIAIKDYNWKALGQEEVTSDWYVTNCRALLRMDISSPEAIVEREIRVESGAFSSLSIPFTLPRYPGDQDESHDLHADILFGGKFITNEHVSDSRFDIKVQFPRTLYPGDIHQYALIYRVPPGQKMSPHYILVPYRRCDSFDVRVRFNLNAIPNDIRIIREAFHRQIEELQSEEQRINADDAGEVVLNFQNLKPGFAYGVQWRT